MATHNAYQPNPGVQNYNQAPNQNFGQRNNTGERAMKFTPLPMTYAELLPDLVKNALVAICPTKTLQPPYPRYYDANAKCEYHSGEVGHSTENCRALKFKVQSLIDSGWLTFQEQKPSVDKNPLSGHSNAAVNAVIDKEEPSLVRYVNEMKKPMNEVFRAICQAGLFRCEQRTGNGCDFHNRINHSIDECVEFKKYVQDLMDRHILQISHQKKEEGVFAGKEWGSQRPKPLVIQFTRPTNSMPIGRQPLVIQTPVAFPYKNDKAVPWKYGVSIIQGEQKDESVESRKAAIDNIFGIEGMTRSGRLFTPPMLRGEKSIEKIREEMAAEKTKTLLKGKAVQENPEPELKERKEVTDEDAYEFLKFIQQSEYKVVDQLNRMPAKVSLLELLMHSDSHRKLLMKILSGAHVDQEISLDKFEGIVSHITANNYLTFTEEELPSEGRGHNKALHISVKCMNHFISRVLIDNGSSLNVMPKATLNKLSTEGIHLRPSTMVVRAFDGSKREVVGEVELSVQVGPCTFQVVFQVMDISPAYSCLLGRPWIHTAGVVPSTLHQKLKFIINDKLIIVSGEEDLLVCGPTSTPYIEAAEEVLETSFQALEIVSTAYIESFKVNPHLSSGSLMVARTMMEKGYECGNGLGKNNDGSVKPLELIENRGRYGLGYKPTQADRKRRVEEMKERRLARTEGREPKMNEIPLCSLYQSFYSVGWINLD